MPKVSVCSSVLNQSEWLREMIQSVVSQSFTDWELVLVDDGSTQDIKSVVDEFKDPRIKLHTFDVNKGIPNGINWAMENSVGEYVCPIAADEWLVQGKLEWQVKYLDDHPDIDATCGLPQHRIKDAPKGERPSWEQYALKAQNRSKEQWLKTFLELNYVPIGSVSALWRRKVFEDIGYFNPQFTIFSDHEWWVRFFEKNHKIYMSPHRWALCKDDAPDSLSAKASADMDKVKVELDAVRSLHKVEAPKGNKVTIGIPCKDMELYLKATIDSVLAQTHQNWEIIFVDDGSTDKSLEIATSIKDPRIQIKSFVENRGQQEALNYALESATGDYFIPLSADDTIEPTYIARCIEVFDLNPPLEFISSQTDFIKEDGSPYTEDHPFKHIQKASNRTQDEWKATFRRGNVYFGVGMIKTQALREIGGFNKDSGVLHDYEIYVKLIQRYDFYIFEEPLTHTRITGKNQSGRCDPLWLRKKYFSIQEPFYQPTRRLVIATAFYESRGYAPYISSMMHTLRLLTMAGFEWDFKEISGDAYVDRAKNTIVNTFLEDPYNTDLFMIDSDMSWNPQAFITMLDFPEELVVGSYPMKNAWTKWTSTPWVTKEADGKTVTLGRRLPDGGTLLQGNELSGGFMRIKRGILERYREAFKDKIYLDMGADPQKSDRVYTEFFCCDRHDPDPKATPMRWGEDRVFSRRLNSIGEKWWIYTNIDFGHYGMTGYHGNFHQFLTGDKGDNSKAH